MPAVRSSNKGIASQTTPSRMTDDRNNNLPTGGFAGVYRVREVLPRGHVAEGGAGDAVQEMRPRTGIRGCNISPDGQETGGPAVMHGIHVETRAALSWDGKRLSWRLTMVRTWELAN